MSIQGDSLLSNISNISVLIKHRDGSEIFNFSGLNYEHADHEVKLDEISNEDYQDHNNSILDRLIKKEEKQCSIIQFFSTPIVPQIIYPHHAGWMMSKQEGISEEENSPSDIEVEEEDFESEKKIKNETKNIPKNYGKAIISFIEKYKEIIREVCNENEVPYEDFTTELMEIKKTINTIADLRNLWISYKYSKCMRILSNLFLRKYSLHYIFNSRICNFRSHVKYRYRLCEAIKNPKSFKHIKDY